MKKLALVLAATAYLGATAVAFAQDAFIAQQGAAQYLAKDELIGAKVYGDDGKIIGDIEDLIMNDVNTVEGIIMGTGGFLGIAEKKVGVKITALQDKVIDGKTVVSIPGVSTESLKSIPAFVRAKPKKSLLERAAEKANELKDKTSATSKDAYEKAKPTLDKAKEAASDAYQKAKDATVQAVEKAKEAAKPEEAPAPAPTPSE